MLSDERIKQLACVYMEGDVDRECERAIRADCKDLATLVMRLCRVVRRHEPNNTVLHAALRFLRSKAFFSPLRESNSQNQDIEDSLAQTEDCSVKNTGMEKEIDAIRAEVERLREDAERYRWLRQPDPLSRAAHIAVLTRTGGWVASGDQCDAAIDAARKG